MTERTQWAAATVVIGAVVGATMVLLGMEPRLALVAAVVVLISATAWLLAPLAQVAQPLSWYDHGNTSGPAARPDRRVQLLTARLRQSGRRRSPTLTGMAPAEPDDEIVISLVAVLDDHLRSEYGIDRANDVRAASDALGPDLARFVGDLEAARSMTRPRHLADTIASIETFTTSPGSSSPHRRTSP